MLLKFSNFGGEEGLQLNRVGYLIEYQVSIVHKHLLFANIARIIKSLEFQFWRRKMLQQEVKQALAQNGLQLLKNRIPITNPFLRISQHEKPVNSRFYHL